MTAGTGKPRQNNPDRTAGPGQPEIQLKEDSQKRTARPAKTKL
jgi:hypothetical protein